MNRPQKILLLANDTNSVYNQRREIVQRFISEGYSVTVGCKFKQYREELEALGFRLVRMSIGRSEVNLVEDIQSFVNLVKVFQTEKPDIVLTYDIKFNVYGGIACRMLSKKYIANITGLSNPIENGGITQRFLLFLYKLGIKQAVCVFFQNRYNREFLTSKHVVSGRTRVIPGSGVNIDRFLFEAYPDDTHGLRFLFIGRMIKSKGIEELLYAAEKVKSSHPGVTFTLIGDCEEDYEGLLKEKERLGLIRWLGYQKDVHPYIIDSHCTVLPSYHEGTANALLESAAIGRPIIATRVPGCMETFDEGLSGLGCQARDADDLTRAIEAFIQLPHEQKAAMGLAGRQKMEREYDRQIVVAAYLEEIQSITADDMPPVSA